MSLKTKLIVLLIAFTLVPLAVFGYLVFTRAQEAIKNVRIAQLNNIADLKKDKIETFFQERDADIRSAERFRNIRDNLPVLSKHAGDRSSREFARATKELNDQLVTFQGSYGYLNVILTDMQGRVLYASNPGRNTERLGQLRDGSVLARAQKDTYFSDIFNSAGADGHFEMLAMAPVRDYQNTLAGIVVLEINMEPIFKFIQDATGLGSTGEALIARKEGEATLFLSPLAHDPAAPLKRVVTTREHIGVPAQKAVQGENGSGVLPDYSGEEVIAAWRYIPSLRWGLVTKIDTSEAFAQVRTLKAVVVAVGFSVVLVGVVVALIITRIFMRPIHSLQLGAEAIAAGDLSHRVGTASQDEIGRLSRSFDLMTEALVKDIERRTLAEAEIMNLNEDLRRHVKLLENSNKELEAFSYSVSHDLRSPLRSVVGFSQALVEDYAEKLGAEGRDFLERIIAATKRMGQLIDDLLNLSRISRTEMTRVDVDLTGIAMRISNRLREQDPERRAEFVIAEGLAVHGDERLLNIALENLIGNAWKFTGKLDRTVIEFGVAPDGDSRTFFVKDNGSGFDMTYAAKLFTPFQRLHTTHEFPGTGIGLATVKRVIERHGGRVWIDGEQGRGTTVYFTL